MEFMVLLAFALTLTVCMVLGLPLLLALVLGYCIFSAMDCIKNTRFPTFCGCH